MVHLPIVWHSTTMRQSSAFGFFSSVQSLQKLVDMDKYILFEPNTKLHQSRKVSNVVVGASYEFGNEAGSIFGFFNQCSVIIKAVKHG